MRTAAELFDRHHLGIFRYLRRATGRPELAEELTQEVFLRVVRSGSGSEPGAGSHEQAWLFRIARNLLLNSRRDSSRRPAEVPIDEAMTIDAPATQSENLALDTALERVPDPEREALLLREVGGLGYEEIADLQETTPDAVRSRIYRARLALRAALSEKPREDRRSTKTDSNPWEMRS